MFKNAIKNTTNYIRPIITGKVKYGSTIVHNYISTIIVLNKNGDILTTATNAELLSISEEIKEIYKPILEEIKNAKEKTRKKIEEKYSIDENTIIAMHNTIVDAIKINGKLNIIKHPYLDLAIIKSSNTENVFVQEFPIFKKKYDVGTSICNIGFAFPEFNAFSYDENTFTIQNHNKIMNFPIFPINSMITRSIADYQNNVSMFETSTSLINGQQGGVVVNKNGEILGILIGSRNFKINEHETMSLAYAINSETIIKFLEDNNIEINII